MSNVRSQTKGKKRRNNSWKDRNTSEKSEALAKEKYNDPSWYLASGQLAKDVASFSFNNALGAPSIINAHDGGTLSLTDLTYRAPGIMALYTAPSFGVSKGGSSALNLAAKNFYSWIRHANSGHSNYDSPDLMLYLGAMDSCYAVVAFFMRAYGVARVYSQTNRYVGDGLLRAMGLDPNEVRSNIAQLRGYINMYITKLSAFATPNTMTMFKRHFWMYSGVYKDEPVTKSQMYMYVPAALWKYVETDGVGHLEATPWCAAWGTGGFASVGSTTPKSLATYYGIANTMLAAMVNSEDINIMSGDILKAYPNAIWNLSLIPEDYSVVPVYSEEVLDQIHNTVFCGLAPTSTLDLSTVPNASLERLGVFQDAGIGDGALLFMPQFKNVWHLDYDPILDMHYEAPTPEEVLVATRNMVTGHSSMAGADSNVCTITDLDSAGADLCLWSEVYVTSINDFNSTALYTYSYRNPQSAQFTELLSAFNKFPIYYRIGNTIGSNAIGVVGEIDNYTILSADDVQRLHDTAILSLLGVPLLGTAAK